MHERRESEEIDQLIDELNTTVKRIGELTQILVQSGIHNDLAGLNSGISGSVTQLLEALGQDADLVEGLVEAVAPDQYLEWLFSVPADSKLFDYRRKYSDQEEDERLNQLL